MKLKPTYWTTAGKVYKLGVYVTLVGYLAACTPLHPWGFDKPLRDKLNTPLPSAVNQQDDSTQVLPVDRLPGDTFWVRPQLSQGRLPTQYVQNLSVTERGLFDVLQMLFAKTNVPLSFEGGADAASRYGVVTLNNLNGSLSEVMNKLGEIMGFFWTMTDSGVLRIMPEQQFVITMPPVLNEDSMAGLTNTMQFLGARDVYLDRINRSLVFRANRRALDSIQSYLDKARSARSLIVYDMNVLQVDLTNANNMGIQWESYTRGRGLNSAADSSLAGASSTATTIGQVARTSTGIETLIFGANFSSDMLVNFLRSQGDVKTLSQPKIGLMNGSNGSIRVGQSTIFVSKVGSQVVSSGTQTTADTQNLKTGLEVSLTGETHESTIYTRISISITELLSMNSFTALGVNLNLPEVADRELKTQVRCRPGDTILLGGITVSRASDTYSKGMAILGRTESTKQTELVITIKPRLLLFDTKKPDAPQTEESVVDNANFGLRNSPLGQVGPIASMKLSPRLLNVPVSVGSSDQRSNEETPEPSLFAFKQLHNKKIFPLDSRGTP
jgi:MSHA biogenesis protein MshL